jgi:hypothetical protein
VHDDAIANYIDGIGINKSTWQQVKVKFLVVNNDGVTGVISALKAMKFPIRDSD